MNKISDAINNKLNDDTAGSYEKAIRTVLERHRPYAIYDDCDHRHTLEDVNVGRALYVEDVGLVCQDGYLYDICTECHTDEDGYQTEHAANAWLRYPCPTVTGIAQALGVDPVETLEVSSDGD